MQSGRKPLESSEEYTSRKDDFLKKLRMTTAMIVVCHAKLEECFKILEDEYSFNMDKESRLIFPALEDAGLKVTEYIQEVIEQ